MRLRYPTAGLLLVLVAVWWWLHDDDEARVREAHAELREILSKTGQASDDALSIVQLRTLQGMFAEDCRISGDAEGLSGSYSPQDLVGLIVSIRSTLRRSELEFGELVIEFPDKDVAVSRFAARLEAADATGESVSESRNVESRMREADGVWRFESFSLQRSSP